MNDRFSGILNFIQTVVGSIEASGQIPFFDPIHTTSQPFYGWLLLLRCFAALLTWAAIFTTFVMRGSSSRGREISVLISLFNISFSLVLSQHGVNYGRGTSLRQIICKGISVS